MMRRGSGMAGGERPHFTHAVVGGLPTFFFLAHYASRPMLPLCAVSVG